MASYAGPTGNWLLDLLPPNEASRLLSGGRIVSLTTGQVILRQDGPIPHVYFPTRGVFGVVLIGGGGQQIEGTTVGQEGMLGLPLFLGVDRQTFVVVSQVSGEAFRIPAALFLQVVKLSVTLDPLLRRYALFRLCYAKQNGACNGLHPVERRMCKWLSMAHDRIGEDEFPLTHEGLAEFLGVRRQTVSLFAGKLQKAGIIAYRRGSLQVLDRPRLEAASCECYRILKRFYDRIVRPESSAD